MLLSFFFIFFLEFCGLFLLVFWLNFYFLVRLRFYWRTAKFERNVWFDTRDTSVLRATVKTMLILNKTTFKLGWTLSVTTSPTRRYTRKQTRISNSHTNTTTYTCSRQAGNQMQEIPNTNTHTRTQLVCVFHFNFIMFLQDQTRPVWRLSLGYILQEQQQQQHQLYYNQKKRLPKQTPA